MYTKYTDLEINLDFRITGVASVHDGMMDTDPEGSSL